MQMLERYLHAIEFWLPKEQRHDIIAEISEDLNSHIEEQQNTLDRNLTDRELEELLRRRGRPLLVANRYRSQQSLIGPVWFPLYAFVLKIVGLCYVPPWLIVFVIVNRVQHPAVNWAATLVAAGASLCTVAFVAAGVVTLIFTILQWSESRTHFLENWSPRKLPPVRDPHRIPLSTAVTELALNFAFVLWFMAYLSSPVLFDGPAFKLSLAPVRVYFFWGYLAVALSNIVLAAAILRVRHWTGLYAGCRLILDLAGGILFCWFLEANIVGTLYVTQLGPVGSLALKNATQVWMERCFPIAVIISVVVVVIDLMRMVRVNRQGRIGSTSGLTA